MEPKQIVQTLSCSIGRLPLFLILSCDAMICRNGKMVANSRDMHRRSSCTGIETVRQFTNVQISWYIIHIVQLHNISQRTKIVFLFLSTFASQISEVLCTTVLSPWAYNIHPVRLRKSIFLLFVVRHADATLETLLFERDDRRYSKINRCPPRRGGLLCTRGKYRIQRIDRVTVSVRIEYY